MAAAAAAATACRSLHLFLAVLAVSVSGVLSKSFTITNNCGYTVWPGILSGAGSPSLETTGFELPPGASQTLQAPAGWSGRLWGRTLCTTDGTTNKFACATGDCGSGAVSCGGGNAAPPATLAALHGSGGGMDFYDVSLVDGSNLPLLVAPSGASPGAGNCAPTGCLVDLNAACPADLRVVVTSSSAAADVNADDVVACKSACLAFGSPRYCCSGEYASPDTCGPSAYSEFFKNACPRAYSYAFDDATSTFTCAGGDTAYTVTFCPGTNSVKSSSPNSGAPGDLPVINGTMAYASGDQQVGAAAATPSTSRSVVVLLGAAVLVMLAGGALS
ncbi:unnamed protein product [Miscanthus lutarioriparius]|uniref:Thaumatin-like protein n=1 Tax=Miscanthus lutarioriparius TaxID=422564 RepID=A0A811RFK5_9POAL|nr:unnamed protein product [Miscanthus lutarioriparius]